MSLFSKTKTLSINDKELFTFRLLLLIASILQPLMGYIRNHTGEAINDPMILRYIAGGYGFAIWALSYFYDFVKRNLRSFCYVFGYIVCIEIFYVLTINHFSSNYALGIFLALFGVSIAFNNILALFTYIVFMNIGAIVCSIYVVDPQTNLRVFISTFVCMSTITFIALKAKIKAHNEIENINNQLINEINDKENAELEVKQLNKELQENIAELELVNNDLEAFTYSVSHDLRAPLRTINSLSEVLKKDYKDKLDTEGIEILNMLSGNTVSMNTLISDLLSFSMLGKHEIKKYVIDMTELVRDVLIEFCKNDLEKISHVKIAPLLVSQGDYTLIQQVFINLISNAFKYSGKNEVQLIEIGSEQRKDEIVYFVKDNGVGFDMNYQAKLFEVFQRLHSRDDYEGFGVGLAIVKRIIDKHGGRTWAESEKNNGATFFFSLPDKH